MKKIVLVAMIILASGCKENNTGIDKKVINKAYSDCKSSLTDSLKSPSSLKISSAEVRQMMPGIEQIYASYGKNMIEDGKIVDYFITDQYRFRTLGVGINYEAQNSFGVSLRGNYVCTYLYSIDKELKSPSSFYLTMIKAGTDTVYPFSSIDDIDSASSFTINSDIKSISSSNDLSYSKRDKEVYGELIELDKSTKREQEAEELRQSWKNNVKNDFQGANLSGI
ncbi:hypothetical protein F3J02_01620 [Acinetobacter sp. Tr-809]|uniref:hypothetical protein n=1 Tax=Acinetobacter sp. Tr-809 TaxID=2608324 RepID=UPI0014203D43|nr:hypothetical protein [Acinetobacter sp. Tr-809]NIE95191.1 hypothetical protein [Acinetobacter sp. Tr-809]